MNFKQVWNSFDDNFKKSLKTVGIVFGVIILLFIGIWIYQLIAGVKMDYSKIEDKINGAAKNYLTSINKLPAVDDKVEIDSSKLIATGYLKEFSKYTNDTGCSSKTTIENNNGQYNYITLLTCDNYKTNTLGDTIKNNVALTGAGIYESNGKYIYKGEVVNNYIKLGTTLFRIVSMDEAGNVLLIVADSGDTFTPWDDRINSELGYNSGKNDYSLSRVRDKVIELYNKYGNDVNKYINRSDWCIDKYRTDGSDQDKPCETTISDYASLLSVLDYYTASLDNECTNFTDSLCNNYNYLNGLVSDTFSRNAVIENTHKIYMLYAGKNDVSAITTTPVFLAQNVNYNNTIISGNGSMETPYLMR